jgi:hypothetical protein
MFVLFRVFAVVVVVECLDVINRIRPQWGGPVSTRLASLSACGT